jgi:DNA topoisomerase-3
MKLVVAEKPSVGRDLSRILGAHTPGDGSMSGNGWVVTWCIGHLVELEEPAAYDGRWKAWRLETLPMLPSEFKLRPAKHATKQLRRVLELLRDRRFEVVVNACDAGREGELIFRYVCQLAGRTAPVQRLWISSLTDEAIRNGFSSLRPGARMDSLADAARSRSEADWLVGMNATRAVTTRHRSGDNATLYSVGRVQTPTLAMLVQREEEIRKFVPRDYFEVRGNFARTTGERFAATWHLGRVSRFSDEKAADVVIDRCRANSAQVEKVIAKKINEPPPQLFDLTSLQRTANRRFGFSAQRTLAIAQALYEQHKLLTYPRTDSRHLSSDVAKELPKLFASLEKIDDYAPFARQLVAQPPRVNRRTVDDARVSDHHAIIPTGRAPRQGLESDERKIFDLVARRFLGAFFPDAEFAQTQVIVRVGAPSVRDGASLNNLPSENPREAEDPTMLASAPPPPDRFFARGRVRTVAGWQAVAGIDGNERPDGNGEKLAPLPALNEGEALDGKFERVAKRTQPPHRHSDATLLAAMESAGRAVEDEALRAAMKDCGLGTPATRAAIIETLLQRGYVARQKKLLVPTETGMALIAALPTGSLASPELTGDWEARLARIARGEESRARFMADIARYVTETVDAIRKMPAMATPATAGEPVARCPRCGAAVRERARDYRCSNDACPVTVGKRIAGREISRALAGVLLGKGRTQVLRGFRGKSGKKFAAALVMDENGEARFDFDDRERPAKPKKIREKKPPRAVISVAELKCPRCRIGTLVTGRRGWGCGRWREGCGFVVWFEIAGRKLSEAQLRDLVVRGKTRTARFFPDGPDGAAEKTGRLILDAAAAGGAARFEPA